MNTHVEIMESIGRLSLALILGSVIGFERLWHQKMAGLRTNVLVALGSCGFVVFSAMVGRGDPTRVAAQVVTGIGFLGAGRDSARGDQRAWPQHRGDAVVFCNESAHSPAPGSGRLVWWPRAL
jgi:hypothetical protein